MNRIVRELRRRLRAGLSVGILGVSCTGLLLSIAAEMRLMDVIRLDTVLEEFLIYRFHSPIDTDLRDRIQVVPFPKGTRSRQDHARLITLLANAGARAVVFDLRFDDTLEGTKADSALASAIVEAKRKGCRVVLGMADETELLRGHLLRGLVPVQHSGTVSLRAAAAPDGRVTWWRYELAPYSRQRHVTQPSLALAAVMAERRADDFEYRSHKDELLLVGANLPVIRMTSRFILVPPFSVNVLRALEFPYESAAAVDDAQAGARAEQFSGRVVLIGQQDPEGKEDVYDGSDGARLFGYHYHLTAILALMASGYLTKAPTAAGLASIWAAAGMGMACRNSSIGQILTPVLDTPVITIPFRVPVVLILLPAIALLAAGLGVRALGVVADITYPITAFWLSFAFSSNQREAQSTPRLFGPSGRPI